MIHLIDIIEVMHSYCAKVGFTCTFLFSIKTKICYYKFSNGLGFQNTTGYTQIGLAATVCTQRGTSSRYANCRTIYLHTKPAKVNWNFACLVNPVSVLIHRERRPIVVDMEDGM